MCTKVFFFENHYEYYKSSALEKIAICFVLSDAVQKDVHRKITTNGIVVATNASYNTITIQIKKNLLIFEYFCVS